MTQQALFEPPAEDPCLEAETATTLSQMGDKRRMRRLATIADRLQRTTDPLDRAKLASEARDLTEALLEETILEANSAGLTWRELGAGLGIPFQTLYRRYGANR